jgi:hypothetical protein
MTTPPPFVTSHLLNGLRPPPSQTPLPDLELQNIRNLINTKRDVIRRARRQDPGPHDEQEVRVLAEHAQVARVRGGLGDVVRFPGVRVAALAVDEQGRLARADDDGALGAADGRPHHVGAADGHGARRRVDVVRRGFEELARVRRDPVVDREGVGWRDGGAAAVFVDLAGGEKELVVIEVFLERMRDIVLVGLTYR